MNSKSYSARSQHFSSIKTNPDEFSEKANGLLKDAYMKLSELFTGHLSSVKTLPVTFCMSTNQLKQIAGLLEDHISAIICFVEMNQERMVDDFTTLVIESQKTNSTKPRLNVASASFKNNIDQNLPLSKTSTTIPLCSVLNAPQKNPSDKFIKRLLSSSFLDDDYDEVFDNSKTPAMPATILHKNPKDQLGKQVSSMIPTNIKAHGQTLTTSLSYGNQPLLKPVPKADNFCRETANDGGSMRLYFDKSSRRAGHQHDRSTPASKEQSELSCDSQPRLDVSGVEDYMVDGVRFRGAHTVVKVKKDIHVNGFIEEKPGLHSIIGTVGGNQVSSILSLGIQSPIYNFINFKDESNFYFCQDGSIYLGILNDPLNNTTGRNPRISIFKTKDTFKAWYTVSGKQYPSSCRGLCIGNNKLFYIGDCGNTMSLDLVAFNQQGADATTISHSGIICPGPAVDLCFTRKYLLILNEKGVLNKVFPSEKSSHSLVKKAKSGYTNLRETISGIPADSEFTAVASSIFEIVVSGFSYSKGENVIYRLGNELNQVDRVVLPNQQTHIHCIKLLIRQKRSFFIAVCRLSYIHVLAMTYKGLAVVQQDMFIGRGPIDGLCVTSEDELIVFEGTRHMIKRILIS